MRYRIFYHPYGEAATEKVYDNHAPDMKQAIAEFDSHFLGAVVECLNVDALITDVSKTVEADTIYFLLQLKKSSMRRYIAVWETFSLGYAEHLVGAFEKLNKDVKGGT